MLLTFLLCGGLTAQEASAPEEPLPEAEPQIETAPPTPEPEEPLPETDEEQEPLPEEPLPPTDTETVPPPTQTDVQALGPTVKEIEVEYAGPKSVSKGVILSNMRTTVGQPYTKAAIEEDVRNLYASGLFSNLRIFDEPLADGVKVIVVVEPKPLVRDIVMAGWSKINNSRLLKELTTKIGEVLDEQKVAADAQKLTDLYQKKGFKDAQVTYKINRNEETGRAVVTFNVNEGGRQYINSIQFAGNEKFTTKQLLNGKLQIEPERTIPVFKTKKRGLFSWIFGTGVIKDEQFQEDLQSLRRFYQSHGYIDVAITGVEFRPTGNSQVDVIISVIEGLQYKVGVLKIEGNAVYDEARIRGRLNMLEDGVYSPQGLEQDLKAIRDLYGEQGYVDTEIIPNQEASIESGRMDLNYSITEGPQSFVERIVIQGNNRTKDKVIRRELAVLPGDIYNTVRAEASKKRLENLNYFEKVDISPQATGIPSRKNMVVTVEEKRTGSFTFGAGYSTIDSIIGFVEFNQGNFDIANWPSFVGAGQKFRARLQYGDKRQDFVLSFVEPWFLNQRLSFGVDLFYRSASYLSSVYDETRYGAHFKFAKALNQFLTARALYKIESIGIVNVDEDASPLIRDEAGTKIRSAIELGLTHDTRDSVFLTRKGHKIDFSVENAGGPLAGDVNLYKIGLEAEKYFLLPWDIIMSVQGAAAVVDAYGGSEQAPIFDRLFAGGGNSVRGFKFRDVGPKLTDEALEEYYDRRNVDEDNRKRLKRRFEGTPIGGGTMVYANWETTFPIMDRVRGAFFIDGGYVNEGSYDFTPDSFNLGAGFGIRLNLPIGPLRLDYGFPILTDEFNDRGPQFHFNVGYQF